MALNAVKKFFESRISAKGERIGLSGEIASIDKDGVVDVQADAGDINLASAKILVGNAGGIAAAVDMGGDATIDNAGAVTVGADKITYAKMQNVGIESVVANPTGTAVNPTDVAIGEAQVLARATGGHVAGQKVVAGMVTLTAGKVLVGTKTTNIASELDISAEGAIPVGQGTGETPLARTVNTDITMDKMGATTITAKAVSYAKIQDTAAGFKVIGKKDTGAGSVEEITIGADQVLAKSGSGNIVGQKVVPTMTDNIPIGLNFGVPAANVADRYVASADMKVGTYTIANGGVPGDGMCHNVTVSHTIVTVTGDTLGTIDIVGTDYNDAALLETITPLSGTIASGVKAFKSITSVTGVGWIIDGVEGVADTITVGFGGLIGLPVVLAAAADLVMATHGTGVLNAPTVAVGAAIGQCTIDLTTTGDGAKRLRLFYQN